MVFWRSSFTVKFHRAESSDGLIKQNKWKYSSFIIICCGPARGFLFCRVDQIVTVQASSRTAEMRTGLAACHRFEFVLPLCFLSNLVLFFFPHCCSCLAGLVLHCSGHCSTSQELGVLQQQQQQALYCGGSSSSCFLGFRGLCGAHQSGEDPSSVVEV